MKTPRIFPFIALLAAFPVLAQERPAIERVTIKDNLTVAVQGGQTTPVAEKLVWPNDVTVFTNATYQVGAGKERRLKEGQTLRRDGTVLNADGSTQPVFDHVAMLRGRVWLMLDGEQNAILSPYRLADGRTVTPEGTLTEGAAHGKSRRLLDGEILRLDGQSTAGKDTVTLINGKVTVQKDGSSFTVAPGRTLMMNEGTKVFGDGYFIKRDGARVDLAEGQTHEIDGVLVRR